MIFFSYDDGFEKTFIGEPYIFTKSPDISFDKVPSHINSYK